MSLVTETLGEIVRAGGGEIRTGPYGSLLHRGDYTAGEGVPVVLPRDIVDGRVSLRAIARVGEADADRLRKHRLEPGDVVYGRRGDLGRRALVTDRETSWLCGTGCLRIRLGRRSAVDPRFLYYALGHPRLTAQVRSQAVGATLPNLNTGILKALEITYPPLSAQRRIVAVLGAYDALIDNLERRREILEELLSGLYREWFLRFRFPGHEGFPWVDSDLGPIPSGWTPRRIRDVATIYRGRTYERSSLVETGGVPWLNLKCIASGGGFRTSGLRRYVGPYSNTQQARAGDIVMAVTDMSQDRQVVARAARVPDLGGEIAAMSIDLIRIEPLPGMDVEYLYGVLRYSRCPEELAMQANGANVLHLAPDLIADYGFLLPPTRLVEQYSEVAGVVTRQRELLRCKVDNLRKTRDLLLPRLLSGDLDVTHLESQPPA